MVQRRQGAFVMEVGLLWFDDSNEKTLEEKVTAAIEAYCNKKCFRGQQPDLCYVNPSLLPDGQDGHLNGILLEGVRSIPTHYFLVGLDNAS